jgi:hypothetical protein
MGPQTKNDCAGEDQQQFTRQIPDGARYEMVVRQRDMVMGPTGLGTKNNYDGEGQQQITALLRTANRQSVVSSHSPASEDKSSKGNPH